MSASAVESPEPSRRRLSGLIRGTFTRESWTAALFLVSSFAYGLALFVVLVTLIALGAGLAITLVGLPILALAMLLWVGAARLERERVRLLLGVAIPNPYRPLPGGTRVQRLRAMTRDPSVWRDLLYDFLLFPLGVAEFVIASVALSPLFFIATPFYYWAIDGGATISGDSATGAGWQIDTLPEALLAAAIGMPLLLLGLRLIVVIAHSHRALAVWMLGRSRTEQLAERVGTLTKSRSDVMDAMSMERRRIERDLHDGAQQQIVSLAMNLGMAREKLDSDPAAARDLIERSHDEAKRAMTDLRGLVQGLYPAVLTDRGLDAAISAVAARSPIPVTVDVALDARLPEVVEATAYFFIVEALANVAKHSQATKARVTVRRAADRLLMAVWDNGVGGAAMTDAVGLGGLRERVSALDGVFHVESVPGQGSLVQAEIPCGS